MRIFEKRRWLVGLLLSVCFTAAAFAAGLNLTTYSGADQLGSDYKATDKSGVALSKGCLIQVIKGSPAAPDPTKPGLISSGTLYNKYVGFPALVGNQNTGVAEVNNVAGEFDYNCNAEIDPGGAEGFYVRVWSTDTANKGAYYNTKPGTLKGAGTSPTDMLWNLKTSYKAVQPPKPQVSAGGFSLSYNASVTPPQYLPSFTVTAADRNDPTDLLAQFETVGYNVAIRKRNDSTWKQTASNKSMSVSETDPANMYFVADGVTEYEIRAQAWNYFGGQGDSDWSDPVYFTIPTSGGSGGVLPALTVELSPPANDQNIIPNSLCLPSLTLTQPKAVTLTNAQSLADLINEFNGGGMVAAICRGDAKTGTVYTAMFDTAGALVAGSENFDLAPRVPLQIYVYKAGSLTIK